MTQTISSTRLADVQEIKELNARYNFAVDEHDNAGWANCFTRDGVFHALLEGHTPTGFQQLSDFVDVVNDAFGAMHHLTTNEIIDVTGDTATQKCYLLFFARKDGHLDGSICVYDDALTREDGAWKYSSRNVIYKTAFTSLDTAV